MNDSNKTDRQLNHQHAESKDESAGKLLGALADNSTIGIYIVEDGKFRFTNHMFQRYVGYSEEELLGMESSNIVYPEDREMVREKAVRMLKCLSTSPYEFRYVNKNGDKLWVMESVTSIQYKGKQAALGSFVDTTQRRYVEERALQLLEDMNDGYGVIRDESYVFVNRRFCEIFGYRPDQLIGMPFNRLVLPEYHRNEGDWDKEAQYDGAVPELHEMVGIKEDGTTVIIEANIKFIQYEGNPAFSVIIRDITGHRQKEIEISESEGRFYIAFHENPSPMTISTLPEGRVVYANDSFLRMVEYSREEVIGHTSVELNIFRGQEEREQVVGSLLDKEKGPGRELTIQTKAGKLLTVLSWGKEVTINGQPHFVSMSIDITDRINLEKKHIRLLEDMNDGYGVIQDGKYVYINSRFSEILGYSPEQIKSKPFDHFFTPENRQQVMEVFERIMTSGEAPPKQPEATLVKQDGTEVIVEASIESTDYEGKPAFSILMRDITVRKQLEENYRQLLDDMNDAYHIIQDGKVVFANRRFCEMYGYSPEQVIGMPISQSSLPENRQDVMELYEKTLHGEAPPLERYEGIAVRTDGTTFIGESSLKAIQYEGKPAFSSITRDITERRRAEVVIRESEEKLRLIFASVPEGIIVSNVEGQIIDVNESVIRMYGCDTKGELIGKNCIDIIAEKDHARFAKDLKKVLNAEGRGVSRYILMRKDGNEIPVVASAAILQDTAGQPAGIVAVFVDITEQQKMQEKLMRADRLASIGQLAGGIAHEINNPLGGVLGVSQLLMAKDIPNTIKEDVEIIHKEANRAANIVKGLLTFIRDRGDQKAPEDINRIIQEVLQLRSYQQKARNIDVDARFAPELPYITVNSAQMQQVFMNLIINAEQAMYEANGKGRLEITTGLAGEAVRIIIQDDGPGIAPEHMNKLFTPFFTTKDIGKGTGLGLSICHGIITEHGGKIYAESEPDKGARFILELPVSVD